MTTTHTNGTVLATAGIDTANLEFPDLEIPVLTGIQRQGDLIVVPSPSARPGAPLREGVAVVEPDAESPNSHVLLGDGDWQPASGEGLAAGWLTVPEGGEAFLIHTEEHNALGIGPGSYEIRRQREWDLGAAAAAAEAESEQRRIEQAQYRRVRD